MIKAINSFRYSLFRSICCSKSIYYVPFFGVLSVAELLGVALIIVIMLAATVSVETDESEEHLVDAIILSIIFATRNNVLTLFLGISWEKALLFHKALSFAIFLGILAHGIPKIPDSISNYSNGGEDGGKEEDEDGEQVVSGVILQWYYCPMIFCIC